MNLKQKKKLTKGTLWLAVITLLIGIGFLSYFIIIEPHIEPIINIFIIFLIFSMLYIVYYLIIGLTKYKREILMSDEEKRKKWKILSSKFKIYENNLFSFSILFFSFMILASIIQIIVLNDGIGWGLLIVAIALLITNIINKKRFRNKGKDETKN